MWEYGYHHAVDEPPAQGDLFLYHIHRLNFAEAWDKNQRWQRYQFDPVAVANSYSVQNQLTSLEEFRVWFYDTTGLLPFLGTAFGPLEPLDGRIRRELAALGVEP